MKTILLLLLAGVAAYGGDAPASFERDVAPILQRRCASCHDRETTKGGYRLDTFAHLLKAGDSEAPPAVAGKPAESELLRLITTSDDDERMPQKSPALPSEEIALIRRWIDEGAAFNGDRNQPLVQLVRGQHLRPAPPRYARPVAVTALAFNGDGRRIAAAGYREITLWDTASATLARRVGGLPERIAALAWHPESDLIAVVGGTPGQWGSVALVDPRRGYEVRFLCDLPDLALGVAFSGDGKFLAAGCTDRSTRVFEIPSGKQVRLLRQHADWVQSVAFNPAGSRLVTTSRDRTARVLDTAEWEVIATYQDHDEALTAAAFTADGSRIVSATRSAAHVWHPEQANRRDVFLDSGGGIAALVHGPFGLAAGCADGGLRLYQIGEQRPWLTLPGHRDAISSVAVSRTGGQIASGAADGTVIVWSNACWAELAQFTAAP